MSILITGGCGFIGTHLCRKLRDFGQEVVVLDLKTPQDPVPGVTYRQGDARDAKTVEELVSRSQAVYHLAATVSVPLCQNDPVESYSNNLGATLTVLDAVRRVQVREGRKIRVAFASTAALYGDRGNDGRALSEEDVALQFSSYYAAQKHASEQALSLYAQYFGIPALSFRFFNVYGPGQDPTSPYSGVITIFARLAREGKPLQLNDGGIQTRDFVSVYDLVEALSNALSLSERAWDGKAINLGTGKIITVRELAEVIRELSGKQSELIPAPARAGDVLHSRASIRRAEEILSFKPKQDFKNGLTELI